MLSGFCTLKVSQHTSISGNTNFVHTKQKYCYFFIKATSMPNYIKYVILMVSYLLGFHFLHTNLLK